MFVIINVPIMTERTFSFHHPIYTYHFSLEPSLITLAYASSSWIRKVPTRSGVTDDVT